MDAEAARHPGQDEDWRGIEEEAQRVAGSPNSLGITGAE